MRSAACAAARTLTEHHAAIQALCGHDIGPVLRTDTESDRERVAKSRKSISPRVDVPATFALRTLGTLHGHCDYTRDLVGMRRPALAPVANGELFPVDACRIIFPQVRQKQAQGRLVAHLALAQRHFSDRSRA